MKLTSDAIARAALAALNEVGLDGLTMRVLAKELGVQAPTLYWHVKNKQELLDAMADLLAAEATEGLEAPRRDETWQDWLVALAVRNRRTLLRYRDGARVAAGAYSAHPAVLRTVELILRTLQDAGFEPATAARAFPVILHYTIGFTIEEQARAGAAYERNPYAGGLRVDAERYPLTAGAAGDLYDEDTDANFEYGLRIVLSGISGLVGHGDRSLGM
ncbi:TetR/AcrR family transcriptional regulator C-terminal domain-containing protein [Actinoplanes sp. NPDC051513]|uniref:TetR/AcrR family transcriptional regulator C-terminal domain-containing protein n=1 Tax=Actinoplanes sp. NPDC051513 TaxID=3363908 RepID=UPI0037A2ECD7